MTAPTAYRAATIAGGVGGCALAAAGLHGWAAVVILAGVGAGVIPADLRHRRIPTRLVAIGATAIVAAASVTSLRDGSWNPILRAAGGAVVVGGAFLIVHLVQPRSLGFGDVRLAALTGALTAYGTASLAAAPVAAALAAVAVAVVTIVTRSKAAAFAPYLVVAAAVTVVVSIGR